MFSRQHGTIGCLFQTRVCQGTTLYPEYAVGFGNQKGGLLYRLVLRNLGTPLDLQLPTILLHFM